MLNLGQWGARLERVERVTSLGISLYQHSARLERVGDGGMMGRGAGDHTRPGLCWLELVCRGILLADPR